MVPDGEGVALVGLEGVASELPELAVLIAELVEQAERGAATATEAIRSVMDLEINTGRPFMAGGGSHGTATRHQQGSVASYVTAIVSDQAGLWLATGSTSDLHGCSAESIRRLLLFCRAINFGRRLFLNDGFIVGRATIRAAA
jgi:hypothetical protein